MPPDLLYRIALCQEGLGQWEDALASLRGVWTNSENPVLKAAASFGQARLRLRMNEPRTAITLLRSIELQQNGDQTLPENMTREIAFLVPFALAQVSILPQRDSGPQTSSITGELISWSLDSALEWADAVIRTEQFEQDALRPANATSCRLLHVNGHGIPRAETNRRIGRSLLQRQIAETGGRDTGNRMRLDNRLVGSCQRSASRASCRCHFGQPSGQFTADRHL